MPLANIERGTKICSRVDCQHSGKPQPVTNFSVDKRARDGLKSECLDCGSYKLLSDERKDELRELRAEYRQKGKRDLAVSRSTLIAKGLTSNKPVSHMDALAEALREQAGSYKKIAEDYMRILDDPYLKPQHKIKLFEGLFRVFNDSDKQNPGRGDLNLLTDEELEEQIRNVTEEILERKENESAIEVECRDVTE